MYVLCTDIYMLYCFNAMCLYVMRVVVCIYMCVCIVCNGSYARGQNEGQHCVYIYSSNSRTLETTQKGGRLINIYLYTHMYVCTYKHAYTQVYTSLHMYTHICKHTYTYRYIYIHANRQYVYTHILTVMFMYRIRICVSYIHIRALMVSQ